MSPRTLDSRHHTEPVNVGGLNSSLAIAVGTLAARDPSNAVWQRDLLVSLAKLGQASRDTTYLKRAFNLALSLKESGKLAPQDGWMLDALRKAVAQ